MKEINNNLTNDLAKTPMLICYKIYNTQTIPLPLLSPRR